VEDGNSLPKPPARDLARQLIRNLRPGHVQHCQRAKALEGTTESLWVIPKVDVSELGDVNVGCDALRVLGKVRAPVIDLGFRKELDSLKGSLLAPPSPLLREERRGEEAGEWEVVDDRVDELLGK